MTATTWDTSYQITSIISVVGSGLVVLTLVLFKSMRNKLFMQIIANISMADMLGNIEYVTLYRPSNGAFWCSMQGFLNLYAYPASWLWTTMLVRFLYDLAVYREIRISFRATFLFCWGAPLVPTLLFFAFAPHGTYTRHGSQTDTSFCSYGGHDDSPFIWHVITYYGLFILCVIYMAFLYTKIRKAYDVEAKNIATMNANSNHGTRESEVSTTSSATLQGMKLTSDSLLLNPLIMICLWAPHTFMVLLSISEPSVTHDAFNGSGINLKIMHGFLTSVLFFYKSQVARNLWLRLLCCKYKFQKTDNEEIDEENMYRESENRVSAYRISETNFRMPSPSLTSLAITNPINRVVTTTQQEIELK